MNTMKCNVVFICIHPFLFIVIVISCCVVEFFKSYLQNIAIPLELSPAAVRLHLCQYEDMNLCTHESLCCTLRLLSSLNAQMLSEDQGSHADIICSITLMRMVDPVLAADNFSYERAAIVAWFASGHMTSPVTNAVLPNLSLRPNTELKERLALLSECDLSHFLEYFIFEVLFRHLFQTSMISNDHYQLLFDLVTLAAGSLPNESKMIVVDSQQHPNISIPVLPSSAARTGIIREIQALVNANADNASAILVFDKIKEILAQLIAQSASEKSYLDVPLAVSFMTVEEDNFSSMIKRNNYRPLDLDIQKFHLVLDPQRADSNPLISLTNVAMIRAQLTAFAELLCQASADESLKLTAFGLNHEISSFFTALLANPTHIQHAPTDEDVALAGVFRGLKMFLFKQIERRKGISFLRNSLLEPPLSQAPWLIDWKQSIDVSFSRFLGSNKVK